MIPGEPSTRVALVDELVGEIRDVLAGGTGLSIRLVGEAGIGKSTVSEQLLEAARSAGAMCWRSAASDVSSAEPLAAITGLRADRVSERSAAVGVRSFFDDLNAAPMATSRSLLADRFALRERASELAESIAQESAIVLIEDLHWADPATIDACVAFAEVALTHPLVVVVNHRPVDPSEPLSRAVSDFDAFGCRAFDLGPLSSPEIEALVESLCGGGPTDALLDRVRGAGGNPFLVREYVDGLLAEGRLAAIGDGNDESTPESFRRAVEIELARLGDEVARTLRAASVIGEPIDVVDLGHLTGRSVLDLTEPLDRARSARMIDETTGVLRFRHDLVRRAVYERMPISVRSALHRQLAEVLSRRGASSSLIGSHLVLGVADEDPEAARLLREAASDVMVVDPDSALAFLDRAVDCGPEDVTTRRLIQRSRMDALTAAGRVTEAESVLQWLLESASPADRAELMARGGGMAAVAGDGERAMRWLTDALDAAVDDQQRSPILALCSLTWATLRQLDDARDFARQAMEAGERSGEPIGRAVGMGMLGRMSTFDNELADGLELGARSVAIADADVTGGAHSYLLCLHHGMTLFDADRLDEAVEAARHGVRVADRFGFNWTRPLYSALVAATHHRRGAIDEARAEAETSITMGEQMESRQGLTWAYAVAALAAVEQGDLERAAAAVERGWHTLAAGQGVLGADHLILAGYRVAMAEGRVDEAYGWLSSSWQEFIDLGLENCLPLLGVDLAAAAHERGDVELLTDVRRRLREAAIASGVDATLASVLLVDAIAENDAAAAAEGWRLLGSTERRLEHADWAARFAHLVSDDPSATERWAATVFAELGATARLPEPEPSVAGPADEWADLTAAEEAIVRLLATGRTNAQIAVERGTSRRTVESHLGRVYRKLGIDGRVALTVAAAARFGSVSDR